MRFDLHYGKQDISFEIPEENLLKLIKPNEIKIELQDITTIKAALMDPIGSKRLSKIVKAGEKIAIITSDITRPMPSKKVLPLLLEELYLTGCKAEDITIVFALGSHRKHTPEEMRYLVGDEIFESVICIDSDAQNCKHLGITSRGTPVDIFTPVAEADRRICLGNIEYHYFAGYSGGAKAIMPGVSNRDAIQHNHSRMVEKQAAAGILDGNPVRADIDEVAKFLPIDFILNVVLNESKQIIFATAGHYIDAHREGCKFLDTIYKAAIPERADIVIVSAGGFPKDINLYQAQKALDNAKHAVKENGIIILAGSCKEGLGEHVFEEWMTKSASFESMIERIQTDFQLGGHKAAAIGIVLSSAEVYLVSDLDADFVNTIFLKPFSSIQQAVDTAFAKLGAKAKVIIIPYGGSSLPMEEAN